MAKINEVDIKYWNINDRIRANSSQEALEILHKIREREGEILSFGDIVVKEIDNNSLIFSIGKSTFIWTLLSSYGALFIGEEDSRGREALRIVTITTPSEYNLEELELMSEKDRNITILENISSSDKYSVYLMTLKENMEERE